MGVKKQHYLVALLIATALPFILAEPAFAETPAGLTQVDNFLKTITTSLSMFVGSVGIIVLVIAGYMYMTSAGNPERLDRAKNTAKWAFFGMALVIGALVLANIIISIAKQSFGG